MTEQTKRNECLCAADFAGHCTELAAWRMLKELTSENVAPEIGWHINPLLIAIGDDGSFSPTIGPISPISHIEGFAPPEAATQPASPQGYAWSLAASVYFCMMGRQLMNGKGGRGQHEKSKVPYLRSSMPELSQLLQRCLQYLPDARPSIEEVHKQAEYHYNRCLKQVEEGPGRRTSNHEKQQTDNSESDFWPENMDAENQQKI